ncbi:MAG: Unknown protein [uncultured Sulfurovum sp.]|uniref:Restriction endonuclease n=1 Tax=uncultured Sulfurovum sp. TaxID=269237 RepID=A0A6S6TPT8_9BACT|nr:MAG: Unknown protein [uncultured Sulfurovum sp.]
MCDYTKLFREALATNKDHTKWDTGDYSGIKTISNLKVGNVGEAFIVKVCHDLGIDYTIPTDKGPWDIVINGIKFEVKTATEDVNGSFQFNHIRYHREYEAVLCLGISPTSLQFNLWSKADIVTGKAGRLVSMEKNANASYKLTKRKNTLYEIELFKEKIDSFTI